MFSLGQLQLSLCGGGVVRGVVIASGSGEAGWTENVDNMKRDRRRLMRDSISSLSAVALRSGAGCGDSVEGGASQGGQKTFLTENVPYRKRSLQKT